MLPPESVQPFVALRLFPGVSFPLLRWLLAGTHLCTSDALGAGMHSAPVLTAAASGLWRGVGYTAGSRGCCCFSSDGSPFSCTRSPSHCSHTGGPSSLLGISSAKGQRSRCPPTAVLWPRLASGGGTRTWPPVWSLCSGLMIYHSPCVFQGFLHF